MSALALVAVGKGVRVGGKGFGVLVAVGIGIEVAVELGIAVGVSVCGHCMVTVGKVQAWRTPTNNRLIRRIGWRVFMMKLLP